MSTTGVPFLLQQVPHLPGSIGFPRILMELLHVSEQGAILLGTRTFRPTVPRIKPTATDVERLTQARHPELLSMLLNKGVLQTMVNCRDETVIKMD